MEGFFSYGELDIVKTPDVEVPKCGKCGLSKTCKSPKIPISGKGKKGIFILGEAPGREEDNQGKPFVGESGRLLRDTCMKLGVDLREDCFIYNSLICRPPKNATPSKQQIDWCRPNVLNAIRETNPTVIVLLGQVAVRSLIGHVWKNDPGKISKWVGQQIPSQRYNAWICPNFHPSYLLHAKDEKSNYPVMVKFFEKYLERAFSKTKRPWDEVPNFASQVEVIMDSDEAARIIRKMTRRGWPFAIDYETDRLKPDRPEKRIVTCSICWRGKRTIAYPWMGKARKATREALMSPVPKIAANMKFEDRWTRREFGEAINNLYWDTMLNAHLIDNRDGVTGLDFQAFVVLGQESYYSHIESYLKAKDANSPNRITELDLRDLLLYNGLDSLLEWHIGMRQMNLLRYPLP
jgi:uracil-DNA glycosylase